MCVRNFPQFLAHCKCSLLATLSSDQHTQFCHAAPLCAKHHARRFKWVLSHLGVCFPNYGRLETVNKGVDLLRQAHWCHSLTKCLPIIYFVPGGLLDARQSFISDLVHSRYSVKIGQSRPCLSLPSSSPPGKLPLPFLLLGSKGPSAASVTCFLSLGNPTRSPLSL